MVLAVEIVGMFYRILNAPPGYEAFGRFMVVKYRTLEYLSHCGDATGPGSSKFFATLHDARQVLPTGARQLYFQRTAQFLELWEVDE